MGLFLTKTFQKNFKKLPQKTQHQVEKALQQIYLNPTLGKKLLSELEGEYSYRIGKFRINYFIDMDDNIWVETVRHRKDVYKKS